MMDRAHLLVVVSHDMDSLTRLCSRGIWLENGRVRMDGPMDQVIDAYEQSVPTRAARPGGRVTTKGTPPPEPRQEGAAVAPPASDSARLRACTQEREQARSQGAA
jgi:ABC-type glutathione transport system ATPase component